MSSKPEQASEEASPREEEIAAARRLALLIAEAGLERKAQSIEIIDVVGIVDYADFVVVMSGRSDRQVAAIARSIETDVKKNSTAQCLSVEGLPQARWVLLDFADVIVHIFHEDTRGYYDLESLWIDAPRIPFDSPDPF